MTGRPVADQIALCGLRGRGHHGVLAAERRDGQDFVVDLVLHLDTRAAASSDDLTDTVSYATLARAVMDVVEGEPVALLETLAQRIADVGLADERVLTVDVTIHKPGAPMPVPFADVTVTIRRRQQMTEES